MLAINLESEVERPDFVALDKEGQIILIAEVKGNPFDSNREKTKENAIWQIIEFLQAEKFLIPFAMFVDLENVLVFRWDGSNLLEVLNLNTADVLSHYEPEFHQKQIFHLYLAGLTEAWISDFCYHWKSEIPPGSKEMTKIGLSQLLEDGLTQP
ncbi:MAG: hypothetical protein KME54_11650 [Tolypothrix brevis GSE-NOS-MK-07-07A]|jgi:hypothetical protein|nr:hypothetical protein [Tolypothrix brevis GSE-NOS-MK-07-07A]